MDKKQIRKTIKDVQFSEDPEVAKFDEQKETNDHLENINEKLDKPLKVELDGEQGSKINNAADFISGFLKSVKGDKGDKGEPIIFDELTEEQKAELSGKDGYTPVKGEDYFTDSEINNFKKEITPIKGKDYRDGIDGKDGYTPIKGKDYFDGKDGYTPIKGKDYFDGKDADIKDVVKAVKNLKGEDRIDISTLKGSEYFVRLEQMNSKLREKASKGKLDMSDMRWHGGGLSTVAVDGTTITGDGTPGNPLVSIGGSGGGGAMPSHELVINLTEDEVVGKQYQSFANAFAYISTQTPSATNTFAVRFSGKITQDVVIPEWVSVVGDNRETAIIDGSVNIEASGRQYFPSTSISNATIGNLEINVPGTIGPITYATEVTEAYAPDTGTFIFNPTPNGGTYTITINGVVVGPINYNDGPATIQTLIRASDPSFADVSVSGSETSDLNFTFNNLPAQTTTMSVDASGLTPSVTVKPKVSFGVQEVQTLTFTPPPTQGDFQLTFLYESYLFMTEMMSYTATEVDIQSELNGMLQTILDDTGDDLGVGQLTVSSPNSGVFEITMTGYPGASPVLVEVDPTSCSLESNIASPGGIAVESCIIVDATNSSNDNWGVFKNCVIYGGDFTGFSAGNSGFIMMSDIDFFAYASSTLKLPSSINLNHSSLYAFLPNSVELNGGEFRDVSFPQAENIIFNAGDYSLYNCSFSNDFTITGAVNFQAFSCSFGGSVTVDDLNGATMMTVGCSVASGYGIYDSTNNGWTNKGDIYDPTIMGVLSSTEYQGAVDELSSMISPTISLNNEIIVNPQESEIAGKQYESFSSAFAYIATQSPSTSDPWTVRFTGSSSEDIIIPTNVTILGNGFSNSILNGKVDFEAEGSINFPENVVRNATIVNLNISNSDLSLPEIQSDIAVPYYPTSWFYKIGSTPTSGTYNLAINGRSTLPIQFDADEVDVKDAIIASDPNYFYDVSVSGDHINGFTVVLSGLSVVGTTFVSNNISLSPTTVLSDPMWYEGTTEIHSIVILGDVNQGEWNLSFDFQGDTYISEALSWDCDESAIIVALQGIFSDVYNNTLIDLGISTISATGSITNGNIMISLFGYPGNCGTPFYVDPKNTLGYSAPKNVWLEECYISGLLEPTANGINTLTFKDCVIIAGNYSCFGTVRMFDSEVIPDSDVFFPSDFIATGCNFLTNKNATANFASGVEFIDCHLNTTDAFAFAGSFTMTGCYAMGNINAPKDKDQADMVFNNCLVSGGLTVGENQSCSSNSTFFAGGVSVDPNGSWKNSSDSFNNEGTILGSNDVQNALNELASLVSANPNVSIAPSGQYSVTESDEIILVPEDTELFLPPCGNNGKRFNIIRTGTDNTIITPDNGATISGETNLILTAQWQSVVIVDDGSNWVRCS